MKQVMTINRDISELSASLGALEGKTLFLTRKKLVRTVHIPVVHRRRGETHELKATVGSGTGYMEILCRAALADNKGGGTTVTLRVRYALIYRVLIGVILIASFYYAGGQLARLLAGEAGASLDLRAIGNLLAPLVIAGISVAVYFRILVGYGRMLVRHFLDCVGEAESVPEAEQ
jgi:hypothetical protein